MLETHLIQNAAVTVPKKEDITPGDGAELRSLLLVCKSLNVPGPKYIYDCLSPRKPSRPVRSSCSRLLTVPRIQTQRGEALMYAPVTWNKLPDIRFAPTLPRDPSENPLCAPLPPLNLEHSSRSTSHLYLHPSLFYLFYFFIFATSLKKVFFSLLYFAFKAFILCLPFNTICPCEMSSMNLWKV